jgi:hypothetical protein
MLWTRPGDEDGPSPLHYQAMEERRKLSSVRSSSRWRRLGPAVVEMARRSWELEVEGARGLKWGGVAAKSNLA